MAPQIKIFNILLNNCTYLADSSLDFIHTGPLAPEMITLKSPQLEHNNQKHKYIGTYPTRCQNLRHCKRKSPHTHTPITFFICFLWTVARSTLTVFIISSLPISAPNATCLQLSFDWSLFCYWHYRYFSLFSCWIDGKLCCSGEAVYGYSSYAFCCKRDNVQS